jgi:hypothetical protein
MVKKPMPRVVCGALQSGYSDAYEAHLRGKCVELRLTGRGIRVTRMRATEPCTRCEARSSADRSATRTGTGATSLWQLPAPRRMIISAMVPVQCADASSLRTRSE